MGFWDSLLNVGAGLLGGVLGGIGGSNANNASSQTTTEPWKYQQPYLIGGFQDAANIYNALKMTPYYQGQTYAGLTPLQLQAIGGIRNFATGAGQNSAMGMLNTGMNSMRQGAAGQLGIAGDLSNFRAGPGTNFSQLTNFDPENATRQNIRDASQYANNPYLAGEIDAVSQDIRRSLTEDVLPSINRAASSSGLTNSSRAGVAEGIALRGAQDRIGDIASTMRSQAYQQGLGTAEGARSTNLGLRLNALNQGLSGTENARQFNANSRLNALANAGNMYGSAFGQGLQGSLSGSQQMYNNLDAMSKAGALKQQNQQNMLTDAFNRWQNTQNLGFDRLGQYMALINGNYGSTSTTQANNGMPNWLNALQGGIGGIGAGLGLYNNFRNMYNQNQGFY